MGEMFSEVSKHTSLERRLVELNHTLSDANILLISDFNARLRVLRESNNLELSLIIDLKMSRIHRQRKYRAAER